MIKPIILSHPDVSNNISTFLKVDYSPAAETLSASPSASSSPSVSISPSSSNSPSVSPSASLSASPSPTDANLTLHVANTAGIEESQFMIMGIPGLEQAEIVQVDHVIDSDTITLVEAPHFPHAAGASLTHIPYDKFRVYRSVTGVGGTYALLVEASLQIDQQQNIYRDPSSASPYSYKYCFYNSDSAVESTYSDELPFDGYPDWSLKRIQDGVLGDFGDVDEKFITRDDIKRWANFFYYKVQFLIQGGESPYFIDYVDITSTGAAEYDLATYEMIGIFMIELSTDGGVSWSEPITPKDFRLRDDDGEFTQYDYRLAGQKLHFTDNVIPTGNIIRIWYTTNPTPLATPTDILLNPFIPMLETFHDYCMMRANEKDRKPDLALPFERKVDRALDDRTGIIYKLRKRIKQGNFAMASTNSDSFGGY